MYPLVCEPGGPKEVCRRSGADVVQIARTEEHDFLVHFVANLNRKAFFTFECKINLPLSLAIWSSIV